ncbi:hypothetical protein ACOMHN_066988 [Nucella lapillus]
MSSSSIPAIIQLYIRNGPNVNPVQEERVPILSPEDVDIVTNMKKGRRELDIIGKGKFGTVYRATLLLDGELLDVVVKHCHSASQKSVQDEAQFVQRLHDTGFVPRLHGLVWDCHSYLEDGPCLVQELYADGVTLQRAMRDFVKLPRKIRRRVAWNMAVGLEAIHERGVLLNDIHDRNVLVDLTCPTRSIKYVDMGLATYGPTVLFSLSETDKCPQLAPELSSDFVMEDYFVCHARDCQCLTAMTSRCETARSSLALHMQKRKVPEAPKTGNAFFGFQITDEGNLARLCE